MPARRDANGRWRYRKVVKLADGSKVRVSGTPEINTKLEAERAERDHIARTINPSLARKELPKLTPFSNEYMKTYAATHNSQSEQNAKRSILDQHLLPALGNKRLDEIGVREIEGLRAKLLDERDANDERMRSKKRVNNIIGVLMRLLRYGHEIGLLASVPKVKPLKVPPSKFDFLDDDEYARLLVAAPKFDAQRKPMMIVGADAGLRKGEILGLEWDDVDLVAGTLTVRRSIWWDNRSHSHVGPPKSGRDRKIPMTSRLTAALKAHRHLRGPRVFCNPDGSELTPGQLEVAIRTTCRHAGLRQIGWHVLRHSFGSTLAQRGASPKAIQELMGHSTIAVTMRYMHLAPSHLREAVSLLDAPRGGNGVATAQSG